MKVEGKFVIICDRCGASVEISTPEVMRNDTLIGAQGWDGDVCGQTLCPDCLKVFDAWFDKFMKEERENDAGTSNQ